MKQHEIVWHPLARDDLFGLYQWIAANADPETALEYTSRIQEHPGKLAYYSERGTPRPDLGGGVRTTSYRKRTVVAYRIAGDRIEILRIVHGGQIWPDVPI